MICKICSANRTPPSPFLSASFTGGCIESRWTLKHKPEVKVLTLMCVVLNSWALFPLSFWKSSPGARCSSIYQSRPHPSAAGRYNWHSSYQKSLQDSHSMEPTLRLCHHPPPSVSCQAQSQCGFTPGNLEMKKRRISSSKFRVQGWNGIFFILFPFPHITSSCQIPYYAKPSQELGCAHGG